MTRPAQTPLPSLGLGPQISDSGYWTQDSGFWDSGFWTQDSGFWDSGFWNSKILIEDDKATRSYD